MAEWVVMLDSPQGFKQKLVRVYLEDDNGVHRQVERQLPISFDVDAYMSENFDAVFAIADPLADAVWDRAFEKQYRDLYREVVWAGLVAARPQLATLTQVTAAMEAELLASNKAGAYARLKVLATAATSVQRDQLFVLVAFLVLNEFLADDK